MNRWKRSLVTAIAVVAVLALAFSISAFAYGGNTQDTKDNLVCVEGYVINHAERAVDGTKTAPALMVEAVSEAGTYSVAVDEDGFFQFEELPIGNWNFRLQLPENWEGIVPEVDRGGVAETGITTLEEQEACFNVIFKIRRVFDLTVLKWEELLDGTVQPGEGWDITATPIGDPFVKAQTETTGPNGSATFTVTPGRWILSEKIKSGWTPVTPAKVELNLDQYAAPGAMDPVIFKNREPACDSSIIVEKFGFGTDPKGQQIQLGPLAGWRVSVRRADNSYPPMIKMTDGMGRATFDDLTPGVYVVEEKVQAGWEAMSDNPQTVIHRACETTTVLFQNMEVPGQLTISGHKYLKAWYGPTKGQLVGLSGWEITASLVGTDIMTSTLTNALGEYSFPEQLLVDSGIAFPGATVEVCEEDRDNWIHVSPECVMVTFPYPVPGDYDGVEVNFINVQDPPLPGTAAATTGAACSSTHMVTRGQTLARIAASYHVTIGSIARLNNIKDINHLYPGQKLCIP